MSKGDVDNKHHKGKTICPKVKMTINTTRDKLDTVHEVEANDENNTRKNNIEHQQLNK